MTNPNHEFRFCNLDEFKYSSTLVTPAPILTTCRSQLERVWRTSTYLSLAWISLVHCRSSLRLSNDSRAICWNPIHPGFSNPNHCAIELKDQSISAIITDRQQQLDAIFHDISSLETVINEINNIHQ